MLRPEPDLGAGGDLLLIARARAAARAEIEWYLAAFDASSLPRPKCAALVRAWHALASFDVLLGGEAPQSEPDFVASFARTDRRALPDGLGDMKDDFAAAVVRCARSDPWADVPSPSDRELEGHRRALLRTFAELDRRARRRLPPLRVPWRKVAAGLLAVALLSLPLWVMYRPRWRVTYYPNTSLSGMPGAVRRVLEPDRNWGHQGPGAGLPDDHFSARYETCLVLEQAANVVFTVGSDDGSKLFVDDQSVVDLWGDHPYTTQQRSVALTPGAHTLRLEYWQGGGDARLSFEGRAGTPGADIHGMLHLPASKGTPCAR
jgi:hypothetical protein